jgi:hypothetical protein
MKALKGFEEFLYNGVVKKQSVDGDRARNLILESKDKYIFFKKVKMSIGVEELNSNYVVETCYDILIELLRAKVLLDGYNLNLTRWKFHIWRAWGFLKAK